MNSSKMSKASQYLLAALFAAAIAGVFVIDVVATPNLLLPGGLYGAFVLIAAFFLDFPLVAALAVWAVALHAAAVPEHQTVTWEGALSILSTIVIGGAAA